MKHTRDVCLQVDVNRELFYDAYIPEKDLWSEKDFNKRLQTSGDLGARIQHAFESVLSENDSAIIIGSDCPEINPGIIEQALDALKSNDVVIGPSFDGGYYLIGMNSSHPFLFQNINWSSSTVFKETFDKIESHNLSLKVIDTLSDMDTIQELNMFPKIKAQITSLL